MKLKYMIFIIKKKKQLNNFVDEYVDFFFVKLYGILIYFTQN